MNDELYEIDLKQFNVKKDAFYNKVVGIISRNEGWVNFKKAVFDEQVARDYALLELEEVFGIAGREITNLQNDAKVLYESLRKLFPGKELSKKDSKKLKEIFLEILLLDEGEIIDFLNISVCKRERASLYAKTIRDYGKLKYKVPIKYQTFLKVQKIDNKINEILTRNLKY
ncbi:MAG: hypothetical protein KJI71_00515 [Patescibacteria group bacterium]|nr:hypothetical protein [Patescibacteria group bacterium]